MEKDFLRKKDSPPEEGHPAAPMMDGRPPARAVIQRGAGNAAIQRAAILRKAARRGNIVRASKAPVSQPGDQAEREADRTAERVLRASGRPLFSSAPPAAPSHPAELPEVVKPALASGGKPLDPASRAFFESRFGADLSGVRLHTGPEAGRSAQQLEARAYTAGEHIVMGQDQGGSSGEPGKELLAHELAHVMQQRQGGAVLPIQRQPVGAKTGQISSMPLQAAPAPSIPMEADLERYGRQERGDLSTVLPAAGQEPVSQIGVEAREDYQTHAIDIDYTLSASAQGQRGGINTTTKLHLHRHPGDPHALVQPVTPEIRIPVGKPEDVSLYPISIAYSRKISYSDEAGRKLEVELVGQVWFTHESWLKAAPLTSDMGLASLAGMRGDLGDMQVKITGQAEVAKLLEHDYPNIPDNIKQLMLQASGIPYGMSAGTHGFGQNRKSLDEMGADLANAFKDIPGYDPVHLSDVPGNFVFLNATGGQQYDAIRAYLESRDKIFMPKWQAQIEESLKHPAPKGGKGGDTETIDMSGAGKAGPGLLDKISKFFDDLWDSLPSWAKATLKVVGMAALVIGGVILVASGIVELAAVFGIVLTVAEVAEAIGVILLSYQFLKSIYERSLESYGTGAGNPLTVFLVALADTFGISGIYEGSTNKSMLSGQPLNLTEEQQWERGIGGGLQLILVLLGLRTRTPEALPEKAAPAPDQPAAPAPPKVEPVKPVEQAPTVPEQPVTPAPAKPAGTEPAAKPQAELPKAEEPPPPQVKITVAGVAKGEAVSVPYKGGWARAEVVEVSDDFVTVKYASKAEKAGDIRQSIPRARFEEQVKNGEIIRWTQERQRLMSNRPKYDEGVVDQVWEQAKGPDGKVRDPHTNEELSWDKSKSRFDQWHMGHKPGGEYAKLVDRYVNGEITFEEFLKEYNEPKNYWPEHPRENLSHQHEE